MNKIVTHGYIPISLPLPTKLCIHISHTHEYICHENNEDEEMSSKHDQPGTVRPQTCDKINSLTGFSLVFSPQINLYY